MYTNKCTPTICPWPRSKQHNVERYLKQMKRLLAIDTCVTNEEKSLCHFAFTQPLFLPVGYFLMCDLVSFLYLSEVLFLICISNGSTILKDWIALVSVQVSASARQNSAILIYHLDHTDLTYVWSSSGYTPHHTGIFRPYLKLRLTMLMDLPTFSLLGPAVWPETWQSLVLSTKFRSEVWVLFKTEFQSEYQSLQAHTGTRAHQKWKQGLVEPC